MVLPSSRHLLLGLALLGLVIASPASAVPQAATGATSIYLSSFGTLTDPNGFDLTLTPIDLDSGTAELYQSDLLPSPTVFYGVTAVDLDTLEIFHEGTGLDISQGDLSVLLEDFVVDGDDLTITADFTTADSGLSGTAPIFNLVDCRTTGFCAGLDGTITVDGLGLFLTEAAIGVLAAEFGAENLEGITTETPIGVANSTFQLVPEPSTALLLLVGGLSVATRIRRRR